MSLQFSVEILPAQVSEATRGIFWRQVASPRLLAALGGLLLLCELLLWAALPKAPWSLHVMLGVILLGSAYGMGWAFARHYEGQALKNFQRFHGAPVAVRLEDQAYRYQAAWGEGAIPWEAFDSLWEFAGVWVLLQHRQGGVSVLLPAAALSGEARAFIQAKLKKAA